MSKAVLITGAEGFVGRHLCRLLAKERYRVAGTVLDPDAGPPLPDAAESHQCDLTRKRDIQSLVREVRPSAIVHLAGQSHVPTSWKNPEETFRINVIGTLRLFEAVAAEAPDCRIISIGSAEVYGKVALDDLPLKESHPLAPHNPYAVSKAAQDLLGYQWSQSPGLDIVRVRPLNHTGPGQSDGFVCSAFARQSAAIALGLQEPHVEVGNLKVRRDFLDVRDVCRAYLALIKFGEKGAVYNLASGHPRSVKAILQQLLNLSGKKVEVTTDPAKMRPVDQPVMSGDASRLKKGTGWQPRIPFAQTLEDLFEWWKNELK